MSTYTTAQLISAAFLGVDLGAAALLDSAENVQADLDAIELLAAAGKISSISLTEPGLPVMAVTPVRFVAQLLIVERPAAVIKAQ